VLPRGSPSWGEDQRPWPCLRVPDGPDPPTQPAPAHHLSGHRAPALSNKNRISCRTGPREAWTTRTIGKSKSPGGLLVESRRDRDQAVEGSLPPKPSAVGEPSASGAFVGTAKRRIRAIASATRRRRSGRSRLSLAGMENGTHVSLPTLLGIEATRRRLAGSPAMPPPSLPRRATTFAWRYLSLAGIGSRRRAAAQKLSATPEPRAMSGRIRLARLRRPSRAADPPFRRARAALSRQLERRMLTPLTAPGAIAPGVPPVTRNRPRLPREAR
jgi:hypothetical protein